MSIIEDNVCEGIKRRAELGLQKYGTTMMRDDLTPSQWLQHAQEEAMDFAVYLERLKMEIAPREIDLEICRFEMWMITSFNNGDILKKDESGRYLSPVARTAWASWKAALGI